MKINVGEVLSPAFPAFFFFFGGGYLFTVVVPTIACSFLLFFFFYSGSSVLAVLFQRLSRGKVCTDCSDQVCLAPRLTHVDPFRSQIRFKEGNGKRV